MSRFSNATVAGSVCGLLGRGRRSLRRSCLRALAALVGRRCDVCGACALFTGKSSLDLELLHEWGLDKQWVDYMAIREGRCCNECGASLRSEQLARALMKQVSQGDDGPATCLAECVKTRRFQSLRIAEINTAGHLHNYLAAAPGLTLSSYGSSDPAVPSEDLTNLSYADASFDLVVTSETLEHVPDYHRALREIHRILKPGGAHVFTVPIVLDQARTRQRARIVDGHVEHLMRPTYHGASKQRWPDFLVFFEFGADFVPELEAVGFTTELLVDETNPAVTAFVCIKH